MRDCHAEFILSGMRFFALLRMTGSEGLAMTERNVHIQGGNWNGREVNL